MRIDACALRCFLVSSANVVDASGESCALRRPSKTTQCPPLCVSFDRAERITGVFSWMRCVITRHRVHQRLSSGRSAKEACGAEGTVEVVGQSGILHRCAGSETSPFANSCTREKFTKSSPNGSFYTCRIINTTIPHWSATLDTNPPLNATLRACGDAAGLSSDKPISPNSTSKSRSTPDDSRRRM